MEIIYCSKCGKLIPPGGVDDGKRYIRGEDPICPKCYKRLSADEHSGKTLVELDGMAPIPASQEPAEPDSTPEPPISRLSVPEAKRRKSTGKLGPPGGQPGRAMLLWCAGSAVLALGVVVAITWGRGGREPRSNAYGPPPPGTVSPAPERPGPLPLPAEDEKLKAQFEAARRFWMEHPEDYAGAIAGFEELRGKGKGTHWVTDAEGAIAEIGAARDRAAEDEFGQLKDAGRKLAGAGDYDGAILALEKPPGKFAQLLAPRIKAEREALTKQAEEKFGAVLAATEKLSAEGEPEKGLAELDKVKSVKYAALAGKLAALRARLEKERENVVEVERRKVLAEANRKRDAILDGFADKLLAGGFREAGESLAAEKNRLDPETLALVAADLGVAQKMVGPAAVWEADREIALTELPGREVELQLRSGGTSSGKIRRVRDDGLELEVKFRVGESEAMRSDHVRFAEVAPESLEKLLPPFKPKDQGGQVAAAALAMRSGDLAGADRALALAGDHVLAERFRKKFDVLKLAAAEAAAREAWERQIGKFVRETFTAEQGKGMLAALDAWFGAHGKTEFARGKAGEAEKLRAAARLPLRPEVYTKWPFDAAEAKRRQKETADLLGQPVEQTLDLGGNVKLELVLIPAGEFTMGGKDSVEELLRRGGDEREWWEREQGQHRVCITKPFYLGKYEVTQEQWERVMGNNPARFKGDKHLPVEQVNWDDCQAFMKKLNEQYPHPIPLPGGEGASPVPSPSGRGSKGEGTFRLPTEAEWEHACRAGTDTSFYTGESLTTDQANYNGDLPWDGKKGKKLGRTARVGSYPANPWGLHDAAGNVWEWCGDWYGPYSKEAQTDPKGPDKGSLRVFRGGAWYARPAECRPAGRGNRDPGFRNDGYGLRVLVVVPSRGP